MSNVVVKDFYNSGISILAIVFSLFIAALTLIISAGDNEFVLYLEEKQYYSTFMHTFKYTASVLLISLLCSLTIYCITTYWIGLHWVNQSKWWLVIFFSLFAYSILAAYGVTQDCIRFGQSRAAHLVLRSRKKVKRIRRRRRQ